MCDYSLLEFPNRLAKKGENLILKRLPSGAKGFTAAPVFTPPRKRTRRNLWGLIAEAKPEDDLCICCLPCGARLRLANINRQFQSRYGIIGNETVKFVQISAEVNRFRDAVEFNNGKRVRIQDLPKGVQAHVLSMGDEDELDIHEVSPELDYSRVPAMVGAGARPHTHGTGRMTRFFSALE